MRKSVLAAIFLGLLMIAAQPVQAIDSAPRPAPPPPEYHPRFGAIALDDDVRAAIQKFPDVASCLKPDAVKTGEPDLDAIDWHKIRNDGDAKVCLFMIFERLGDPESVMAWLERQKFKPFGPYDKGAIAVSEAKILGLEGPIFDLRVISVTARRSLEGQYPIFPTHGTRKYIRRLLSTAQSIGVLWLPDGRLIKVSIFYDSIFN